MRRKFTKKKKWAKWDVTLSTLWPQIALKETQAIKQIHTQTRHLSMAPALPPFTHSLSYSE